MEKTKNALSSSMHALKVIAQGLLVFVAALIPIVIVLAIFGIPLIIFLRKRARKLALNPAPPANYSQKIDTSGDLPQDPL